MCHYTTLDSCSLIEIPVLRPKLQCCLKCFCAVDSEESHSSEAYLKLQELWSAIAKRPE